MATVIRARAPLRVSFGGGGTDVPPYATEHGGCVLSTTIDRATYCSLRPREDKLIRVKSLDLGILADFSAGDHFAYDGKMDLAKVVLNHFDLDHGADVLIHSDAPPGSGLGSSSALLVALITAFAEYKRVAMNAYEVAALAIKMERDDLKIPGGWQDQYSAAFGGVNWIEFSKDGNLVTPLRLHRSVREELEYRSILAYVGRTRLSANILHEQIAGSAQPKGTVKDALDATKQIAIEMKRALLVGDWERWGGLLHRAWHEKKQFSTKVSDPHIDALYEAARNAGATGGKLLGAGGGGFLYLFCPAEKKHEVV
ncbi:MAG TPA: GHMP kinase, partial [Candidatus Thermoplasmatota archaeon]|nr:GHMP kinase [Candidatus Thermoplasmatota archaeon]